MSNIVRLLSCVVTVLVVGFGVAQAQDRGSLEDAQAMAERAAAYLEAEGPDVAFPAFNDGEDWHDRDLYVFVFAPDGTCLAHGANASLIGQNLSEATDASGNHFIQDIAGVEDMGWVDYDFMNPQTNEVAPKRSYVVNVGGEYVVGVGAYVE